MKSFEWHEPKSIAEAVKLLRADRTADPDEAPRPLAGGQDLLTTMKDYSTRPTRLVNLKSLPGLDRIEGDARSGLTIGSLVTIAALEEHAEVRKGFPGLAQAADSIASPQIRNLGTVGGNLCQRPRCAYFRLENVQCIKRGGSTCYAESGENKYNAILGGGPSYIVHPSDLAPMLVALGASVRVTGAGGTRTIALESFFTLPSEGRIRRENVLENDEIITHVVVPASDFAGRSTYLKFKERPSLDFALAAVAAAVDLGPGGAVRGARVVLGGVAPIPWRSTKAEQFLAGKKLEAPVLAEAARIALEGARPLSGNAYKVPLTQTLVRRALAAAGKLT